MGLKYLPLSVIFFVFTTLHSSFSASTWIGQPYNFLTKRIPSQRVRQQSQSEFKCTSEGFFADPEYCSPFYRCVSYPSWKSSNYFVLYTFRCPEGTAFDETIPSCNFPYNVPGCGDYDYEDDFVELDEYIAKYTVYDTVHGTTTEDHSKRSSTGTAMTSPMARDYQTPGKTDTVSTSTTTAQYTTANSSIETTS